MSILNRLEYAERTTLEQLFLANDLLVLWYGSTDT
jgi:hypothetical protein